MYQVIVETRINGVRDNDMVLTKMYSARGWAIRKANEYNGVTRGYNGNYIDRKAYVRKLLKPVTKAEAKAAYCKCEPVWKDGEYGQIKLMESGAYGSHASIEELFHRSAGDYYNGNFYVEID